jgi:DNA processing protein
VSFTRQLAHELARAGVIVISGGARGIDTAAHLGALDAGGITVVVAPSGFDRPYPDENRALYDRILKSGGAYISLVPRHVRPTLAAFHVRNAAMVALSHAVAVVQMPRSSGARHAASAARRLGRPLFVAPSWPWDRRGAGNLAELKRGAKMLTDVRDVLRVLASMRLHGVPPGVTSSADARTILGAESTRPRTLDEPSDDSAARRRLLELVRAGATHVDDVCAQSGWSVGRIHQLLLTLTLEGVLVSDPTGRIRIVSG